MLELLTAFICAAIATLGFCFLFHVPKRRMLTASLLGAFGWLAFQISLHFGNGQVMSCFLAACFVAVLGDICSRVFKDAATLFIIPGILPLVPGAWAYYTMLAIIESDLEKTAEMGTQTLLMAGSIAVALMAVASVIKVITSSYRNSVAFFRNRNAGK